MSIRNLTKIVVLMVALGQGVARAELEEEKIAQELAGELPDVVLGLVDYLKDPASYERVGAPMPRGILMYGPPGCGKTTIARAMAKAAGCTFISAVGSQFDGELVGLGAKKIKEFFDDAREKARSSRVMIFIDEVDCLAGKRLGGERNMDRQTLCEFLAQLDGFDKDANKNIVLFAATNRKDFLDEAALRRFDEHVYIGLPNDRARMDVLKFHAKKIVCDISVDLALLAQKTQGWNCSELRDLVIKAARNAALEKALCVNQNYFVYAFNDFVATRKQRALSLFERIGLNTKTIFIAMCTKTSAMFSVVKNSLGSLVR